MSMYRGEAKNRKDKRPSEIEGSQAGILRNGDIRDQKNTMPKVAIVVDQVEPLPVLAPYSECMLSAETDFLSADLAGDMSTEGHINEAP